MLEGKRYRKERCLEFSQEKREGCWRFTFHRKADRLKEDGELLAGNFTIDRDRRRFSDILVAICKIRVSQAETTFSLRLLDSILFNLKIVR